MEEDNFLCLRACWVEKKANELELGALGIDRDDIKSAMGYLEPRKDFEAYIRYVEETVSSKTDLGKIPNLCFLYSCQTLSAANCGAE